MNNSCKLSSNDIMHYAGITGAGTALGAGAGAALGAGAIKAIEHLSKKQARSWENTKLCR